MYIACMQLDMEVGRESTLGKVGRYLLVRLRKIPQALLIITHRDGMAGCMFDSHLKVIHMNE